MDDIPFANKKLGQHWLEDAAVLDAIIKGADIARDDTILEIGPGYGTLTERLIQLSDSVIAVELDPRLVKQLSERVHSSHLTIIERDILQVDLTELPPGYKIVANIPYYLTGNLIRMISESPNPPARAVLLVQKEVAQRIAAGPGEMSMLSATAQIYWGVELGPVVPREAFTPVPKVDSQVVILGRREEILFPDIEKEKLFKLMQAGFSQRRKTVLNSLSGGLRVERSTVLPLLERADINPSLRAQNLALTDWARLYYLATNLL